jgi:predicted metal-binding membrane protein
MTATPAIQRSRVHPTVLGAIGVAWIVVALAELTGAARSFHHDALLDGHLPLWAALAAFLVAWQVMIAAMMLPSSLPLVSLFFRASASQPGVSRVRLAFVAGYAAVWSAFGTAALVADAAVHAVVAQWPWLERRPWLLGGIVLLVAGAFQFSDLKQRCLRACRHPAAYLMRHYGRGPGKAFQIGAGHGLFCLGCCWALMLVSFALGAASLIWMAVLAAVMVFEKTGRAGERGVVPVGIAFLALGALMIVRPGWMPAWWAAT